PPPEAPEEDEPPTGPAPEVMEALRREFGQPLTPPPAAGPAPATPTPGQPPAAPPTTPEATPAQGPARVPTMITRRMREQLVDLGYTTEDIRQMTPQGAWEIITEGRQKAASVEDEELDEQMPRAIPEGMPEQEERTPTPVEDEELDEQMPRAIPEGMPEQEERTPTPAAPQRPAEPETRIEFRDLDELAKSDEGLE